MSSFTQTHFTQHIQQWVLGVVCDLCRVEVLLCTNTGQRSKNLTVFLFIFGHRLFYIIPHESFVAATTYFYTTCYTHIYIKYFIISVKLTVFSSLCLLFPEKTRQSCLAFILKIHSFSFVSFLKQTNKNKHLTHGKTTTVKRRQLHMLHLSSWFCFRTSSNRNLNDQWNVCRCATPVNSCLETALYMKLSKWNIFLHTLKIHN